MPKLCIGIGGTVGDGNPDNRRFRIVAHTGLVGTLSLWLSGSGSPDRGGRWWMVHRAPEVRDIGRARC